MICTQVFQVWGQQAQRAHDELETGALIGVIGDVRIRDGQPWVLVDRFELLGEPRSAGADPTAAEVA